MYPWLYKANLLKYLHVHVHVRENYIHPHLHVGFLFFFDLEFLKNYYNAFFTMYKKIKGNKTYKSIVKVVGLSLTPGQEVVV